MAAMINAKTMKYGLKTDIFSNETNSSLTKSICITGVSNDRPKTRNNDITNEKYLSISVAISTSDGEKAIIKPNAAGNTTK